MEVELVVQQAHVHADVGLVGHLPRYVYGIFVDGRRSVVLIHVLAEGVARRAAVGYGGQVGESAAADLAISDLTPRAADFQVLDDVREWLEE